MSKPAIGVLVTRPRPQGDRIAKRIQAAGFRALAFPVIEIDGSEDDPDFAASFDRLGSASLVVLVSVAAVDAFFDGLAKRNIQLPERLEIAVTGRKSAQECAKRGRPAIYQPRNTMNSEGLILALGDHQWGGKTIFIYRGQTGRELLRETLTKWGANVDCIRSYQRQLTQASPNDLIAQWSNGSIQIALVTSQSIVDGLAELLGEDNIHLFLETPIVTISERIAEYCRAMGARSVMVSQSPDDEDVLACLSRVRGMSLF